MKVILFGGSGMVGQGVLRECLLDPAVTVVLSVGRRPVSVPRFGPAAHAKVQHLQFPSGHNFASVEDKLAGYDACFFCLGVSSTGMSELKYRRITYDLTLAVARTLVKVNPGMTFIYVSGAGTHRSGDGRSMWSRVKGETESALLRMPFRRAYMFRPGFIQPLDGIRSKTASYNAFYSFTAVFSPLLRILFGKSMTDTRQLGRAMLSVARDGFAANTLEAKDLSQF
jgi:uncharacterized protein YbjT (DUF2867 family)